MLDIGLSQKSLGVKFEKSAQLDIFVVVVLHKFNIIYHTCQLCIIGNYNFSRSIDMITYPQLCIVLLIGRII